MVTFCRLIQWNQLIKKHLRVFFLLFINGLVSLPQFVPYKRVSLFKRAILHKHSDIVMKLLSHMSGFHCTRKRLVHCAESVTKLRQCASIGRSMNSFCRSFSTFIVHRLRPIWKTGINSLILMVYSTDQSIEIVNDLFEFHNCGRFRESLNICPSQNWRNYETFLSQLWTQMSMRIWGIGCRLESFQCVWSRRDPAASKRCK